MFVLRARFDIYNYRDQYALYDLINRCIIDRWDIYHLPEEEIIMLKEIEEMGLEMKIWKATKTKYIHFGNEPMTSMFFVFKED